MRIAFISGSYPPLRCGVGDYLQRLTAALAEEGNTVQVLTSRVGVAPVSDGPLQILPLVQNWDMNALPVILRQLRATVPDIVNVQYPTQFYGRQPMVNFLPLFVRAALRVPAVTTVHEFSTYRRLGKWRIGASVLTSNQVIVTDPVNLAQMSRDFLRFKNKLNYVPIAANIDPQIDEGFERDSFRASLGARDNDIVIAYFGFITPSKGIETLLEAFKQACLEDPDARLFLLLVASREPFEPRYASYLRRIHQLLEDLDIGNRVYWTGYSTKTRVSEYLTSADMAVLPFADGVSLRRGSLLAVLAHGLPVISTSVETAPWQTLTEEQGVYLVPANDPPSLAHAILDLSHNRRHRETLMRNAKSFGSTMSWQNIAVETRLVFDKVLGV